MAACMKLKNLESFLFAVAGFTEPKIIFEQYETPAHIAAISLFTIQTQFDALEGKMVLDAGCGPGMLSLGAAALEAGTVIGVDIDDDALETFSENIQDTEMTNIDVVQCDFLSADTHRWDNYFDTVIMNPPFGTKNNAGIDMQFLQMGLTVCSGSVYSLHKTSTRSFIDKKVREWDVDGYVVAELEFELPASYKFHRQEAVEISVDLWKLSHPYTD
ncbi:rRNA N(6)-adenosine-methyltransferase METTL5 [Epargyreus clarus]|uniref:rRNA N(6)-adenosine-methyltransferase METTL5 n=1 Tax=Epargyreus clarus TaxID=520877 RepID=UPI003C30E764